MRLRRAFLILVFFGAVFPPRLFSQFGPPRDPPPFIFPGNVAAYQEAEVTFAITVARSLVETLVGYQWFKNGVAIPGANQVALEFHGVTFADAGSYSATVFTTTGNLPVSAVTLTVLQAQPPRITLQPQSQTAVLSDAVQITFGYDPTSVLTFQWKKNGIPYGAPTKNPNFITSLYFPSVTAADAGDYTITLTNLLGSVTSNVATLSVIPTRIPQNATRPVFGIQPAGRIVDAGDSFYLAAYVDSNLVVLDDHVTYQWFKDGVAIAGAINNILAFPHAQSSDAGTYTLVATDFAGSTTSAPANVAVGPGLQITTYAGGLTAGSSDGPAGSARFNYLTSLTMDGSGNLYALDARGTVVRKITTAGIVSTLAGAAGASGSGDGPGAVARFNGASAIAADRNGNVYVADTGNATVRKIAPDGTVITLAGVAGQLGDTDGQGSAARFDYPSGVAIDTNGNVVVSDDVNRLVRKITPAGFVTTFAGHHSPPFGSSDGSGASASFTSPDAVISAPDGNIYVRDQSTLRKITPAGAVTTVSVGRSIGIFFAFDASGGLYFYDGVTMNWAAREGGIYRVGGEGGGSTADGFGAQAGLGEVRGIVIDPATNNLYFADNTRIRQAALVAGSGFGSIAILEQAPPLVVATGSTVVLTARPSGTVTSRGWRKNGVPIEGANGDTLKISKVQASDAGTYTYVATNPNAIATSTPAVVTVVESANPGRITNLSILSNAGTGAQTLIVGLTVGGNAVGTKPVLIRAIGPALRGFGLTGALSNPLLNVFSGGSVIGSNDDWDPGLAGAFSSVGAFALPRSSADAAISLVLSPGSYSAQITGKGGSGLALAEVYDLDLVSTARHLVNLSARTQVGRGENVLIAGFVIGGDTAKTVLLRGVGPTLESFGVPKADVLADPKLELYAGDRVLASNDNFVGFDAEVLRAVGAFSLSSFNDSMLLLTLPPGTYSAKVSGVGDATGVALVEVYEVP